MKGEALSINEIFINKRLFEIPFFQRNYVWNTDNWEQFLDDMENIHKNGNDCLLGTIICKSTDNIDGGFTSFRRYILIDGQQRFTTLAIFMKVLSLKLNDDSIFSTYFLANKGHQINTGEPTYTIIHNRNDRTDFERILGLREETLIEDSNSQICKCYNYFVNNLNVDQLDYNAIDVKTYFICVYLTAQDDEQIIFDRINSLGVTLTTGELLKNYFFNRESISEYERYWEPTFEKDKETIQYWEENLTQGRLKRNNIETFFTNFLFIKTLDRKIDVSFGDRTRYRKASSIFSNYKEFIKKYNLDRIELIKEIVAYANIYKENFNPRIGEEQIENFTPSKRINFIITELDHFTMIPYFMYIHKNVADANEKDRMFCLLESYVMRRVICKSKNNNYSDLFSENLIGNQINTLEKLKDYLKEKDGSSLYFPNDETVSNSIHDKEQSNSKAIAILFLMENRIRNNHLQVTQLRPFSGYTLEHLMPKKFDKNWPLTEGISRETRMSIINTLGNMAFIPQGLNTIISNESWQIKKEGKGKEQGLQFHAANICILRDVLNSKVWNEGTIEEQANRLNKIAISIWPELNNSDNLGTTPEFDEPGTNPSDPEVPTPTTINRWREYSFDGIEYMSKAAFVPALVKEYVHRNPEATYNEIKSIFNDKLCAKGFKCRGFLCTEDDYKKWDTAEKYKIKRYQGNKPERRLISKDNVAFFVSTQWTEEAMPNIIKLAETLGFNIDIRE